MKGLDPLARDRGVTSKKVTKRASSEEAKSLKPSRLIRKEFRDDVEVVLTRPNEFGGAKPIDVNGSNMAIIIAVKTILFPWLRMPCFDIRLVS
jgi:hypothetical protein